MNRRIYDIVFVSFTLLLSACPIQAELKLGTPFSDHMVLQRDKPVPVWGWDAPGKVVTVEFANQKKTATAAADGKWLVHLDPLTANAQPQSMKIAGESTLTINDILIGEVWLGSGQSNMAMSVNRCLNYEQEMAAANLPLIRMFKEGSSKATTPQAVGSGTWSICSPETVGGFSATLYFTGRELHRELGVPVGLINSSVGGTPIEAWIAADAQHRVPELKDFFETQAKLDAAFDPVKVKAAYDRQLAKWEADRAKAKAEKKPLPAKPRDPLATRARKADIGGLFNGKIQPLIPYAIRGVLWYQGEANAQPGKSRFYQYQLPLLVNDWRQRWNEELPFAWVQLPNFTREGEYWMETREAMLKTLKLPRTGMAIAIDIGDAKDIHPKNKQEVGRRLALWALGSVYQRPVSSTSGPLPVRHEVQGNQIVISFDHADNGLQSTGDLSNSFTIAGDDQAWKPAQAKIEGKRIIVSSKDVLSPAAVRYNWTVNPQGHIVNGVGLPATPFRTDNWPLKTEAVK